MKEVTANLKLAKETKRTWKYEEIPGSNPPTIGVVYLPKWFTGDPPPDKITVTIKEEK